MAKISSAQVPWTNSGLAPLESEQFGYRSGYRPSRNMSEKIAAGIDAEWPKSASEGNASVEALRISLPTRWVVDRRRAM